MKKVVVIGAGIGGLSAAILLRTQGHEVTVIERHPAAGGKMSEVSGDGFRFDTGPSLLTMVHVLESLFESAGARLNDALDLVPLDPLCRYVYPDGVRFDNRADPAQNLREVERIAPGAAEGFERLMRHSASLWDKTHAVFLENPLCDLRDVATLPVWRLAGINAFSTVSDVVDRYVESPHLRSFFKRFTTYNGSSPFLAPATLNVIPHVELSMGAYYVKGGLYRIAKALEELAMQIGVDFSYSETVDSIQVDGNRACGVTTSRRAAAADIVVCNADTAHAVTRLLGASSSRREKRTIARTEPSSSGFVLLAGTDQRWDILRHHTIFFSGDYRREFDQIFNERRVPDDPTIYVANTSFTDPGDAPEGGSNLFIMINTPYLDGGGTGAESWDAASVRERTDHVLGLLERRGLAGLRNSIVRLDAITPSDFESRHHSNRGSIYGTSSNSKASAFLRPRNRHPRIQGLYFCGGSCHPGGGIPLVVLSGMHVAELVRRDLGNKARS